MQKIYLLTMFLLYCTYTGEAKSFWFKKNSQPQEFELTDLNQNQSDTKQKKHFYSRILSQIWITVNIKKVRYLLKKNADPNIVCSQGETPLTMACRTNNNALVKLLLEHNADPKKCDIWGNTPLIYALRKDMDIETIALLAQKGPINRDELEEAIHVNNPEAVKELLDRGAQSPPPEEVYPGPSYFTSNQNLQKWYVIKALLTAARAVHPETSG